MCSTVLISEFREVMSGRYSPDDRDRYEQYRFADYLLIYLLISEYRVEKKSTTTWLAQLLSTAEGLLKRRVLSNLTKLTYQQQPVPIVYKIGISGKN